jgi:hypothetical protein
MLSDDSERAVIERLLARPVTAATQAVWGFTNRTDIVDLAGGDRSGGAAVPSPPGRRLPITRPHSAARPRARRVALRAARIGR